MHSSSASSDFLFSTRFISFLILDDLVALIIEGVDWGRLLLLVDEESEANKHTVG